MKSTFYVPFVAYAQHDNHIDLPYGQKMMGYENPVEAFRAVIKEQVQDSNAPHVYGIYTVEIENAQGATASVYLQASMINAMSFVLRDESGECDHDISLQDKDIMERSSILRSLADELTELFNQRAEDREVFDSTR